MFANSHCRSDRFSNVLDFGYSGAILGNGLKSAQWLTSHSWAQLGCELIGLGEELKVRNVIQRLLVALCIQKQQCRRKAELGLKHECLELRTMLKLNPPQEKQF